MIIPTNDTEARWAILVGEAIAVEALQSGEATYDDAVDAIVVAALAAADDPLSPFLSASTALRVASDFLVWDTPHEANASLVRIAYHEAFSRVEAHPSFGHEFDRL